MAKSKKWLFNQMKKLFKENDWLYPDGEELVYLIEEYLFGKPKFLTYDNKITYEKAKEK